jgi:hypothetical protein
LCAPEQFVGYTAYPERYEAIWNVVDEYFVSVTAEHSTLTVYFVPYKKFMKRLAEHNPYVAQLLEAGQGAVSARVYHDKRKDAAAVIETFGALDDGTFIHELAHLYGTAMVLDGMLGNEFWADQLEIYVRASKFYRDFLEENY